MACFRAARAPILVGWMGLIFLLSADSGSGDTSGWLLAWLLGPVAGSLDPAQLAAAHALLRKGAHVAEYAVLAALWAWNLGTSPGRLGLAWLLSTLYAVTDEWHQHVVPERVGTPRDVAVDASGALVSLLIIRFRVTMGRASPPAPR